MFLPPDGQEGDTCQEKLQGSRRANALAGMNECVLSRLLYVDR